MRRVKAAKSLEGARFLLLKRRVQRYLPRRPGRFFGVLGVVALGGVATLGGADYLDRGSRLESAVMATTGTLGLSVQDVEVQGRSTTTAEEVLKALDLARGTPILAVSPEKARARLQSLPWVRSATVERRLPDTILVRLTERQPLALWQRDAKMVLIDTEGVVVTTEHLDRYASLLLIVGDDAPKHAQALLAVLSTEPDLQQRVQSAVWVGGRRWNLVLDPGITVELPETGIADAWAKLADIERAHALLARDVTKVDMRLSDRVVVQSAAVPAAPKPAGSPAKPAKPGAKPT